MKLPLNEIIECGLELDFELSKEALNKRSEKPLAEQSTDQSLSDAAEYLFTEPANCSIKVNKDGETVYLEGQVKTQFSTQCSRCAEEAISSVSSPVKLQFKPKSYGAALG